MISNIIVSLHLLITSIGKNSEQIIVNRLLLICGERSGIIAKKLFIKRRVTQWILVKKI
ncbi:MAG: hypothetical protein HZA00_05470 [Nitrospinae bacterium]|nr:hypothetical protein [Nitrospinota bacterium]